jgi:positive regulator of sigma E activity
MHIISLFELLLVAFGFYAAVEFEGTMRVVVVLLCLLAVFLVERLDKRIQEDEEVRERLLRYKIEGRKKKVQSEEEK